MSWQRLVRANMRALWERRSQLASQPRLSGTEKEEFKALTWTLRLLRSLYPDAADFLHQVDLCFTHPRERLVSHGPTTGPEDAPEPVEEAGGP